MSTGTIGLIIGVIIAVFSSITAPLILAHYTEKMRIADREAEWARQDHAAAVLAASQKAIADQAAQAASLLLERQNQTAEAQERVAEQAAEAARLLSARQDESYAATQKVAAQAEEAARLLAENTAAVAESASETGKKLDTIHTLVNSNMTQAMQSEFDAVARELASMGELIDLRRSLGQEPTPAVLSALARTQAKLAELEDNLAQRAKIQEQVNKKIGLDVITTTSYRRQGDDEKTSVQVNQETQGAEPAGGEPMSSAEYAAEPPPPPGHGESGA